MAPGGVGTGRARARSSSTAGNPAALVTPEAAAAGADAAGPAPVVVQTQVNLAETTSDPHAEAGWLTAFALGGLLSAGLITRPAGLPPPRRTHPRRPPVEPTPQPRSQARQAAGVRCRAAPSSRIEGSGPWVRV